MPTTIRNDGENQLLFELAFFDEAANHELCCVEVGYYAFAQWAHGADALWLTALHELGFLAYGYQFVGAAVESHNRGLVDHNLVVVDYDGVGCAEVDGYLLGE